MFPTHAVVIGLVVGAVVGYLSQTFHRCHRIAVHSLLSGKETLQSWSTVFHFLMHA